MTHDLASYGVWWPPGGTQNFRKFFRKFFKIQRVTAKIGKKPTFLNRWKIKEWPKNSKISFYHAFLHTWSFQVKKNLGWQFFSFSRYFLSKFCYTSHVHNLSEKWPKKILLTKFFFQNWSTFVMPHSGLPNLPQLEQKLRRRRGSLNSHRSFY